MADQERQMNRNSLLHGLKQSLSVFWNERNRREQNLLSAALVVIVLGLFYVLLIDPALSGRNDLERKLPALHQQAAQLQALAQDTATLSGKAAAPAPVVTRERLQASLAGKGLTPQSVVLSGELAKVQLNGVSFANLIDWLQEAQKSLRLSVTDAVVDAQPQVDTVNASLTLRRSAPASE
jgi:general secretion pathway protein M